MFNYRKLARLTKKMNSACSKAMQQAYPKSKFVRTKFVVPKLVEKLCTRVRFA